MHKSNASFVFHFYILELTSWIWTSPSTKGLKFASPSKWNSYKGFNLEHRFQDRPKKKGAILKPSSPRLEGKREEREMCVCRHGKKGRRRRWWWWWWGGRGEERMGVGGSWGNVVIMSLDLFNLRSLLLLPLTPKLPHTHCLHPPSLRRFCPLVASLPREGKRSKRKCLRGSEEGT